MVALAQMTSQKTAVRSCRLKSSLDAEYLKRNKVFSEEGATENLPPGRVLIQSDKQLELLLSWKFVLQTAAQSHYNDYRIRGREPRIIVALHLKGRSALGTICAERARSGCGKIYRWSSFSCFSRPVLTTALILRQRPKSMAPSLRAPGLRRVLFHHSPTELTRLIFR